MSPGRFGGDGLLSAQEAALRRFSRPRACPEPAKMELS